MRRGGDSRMENGKISANTLLRLVSLLKPVVVLVQIGKYIDTLEFGSYCLLCTLLVFELLNSSNSRSNKSYQSHLPNISIKTFPLLLSLTSTTHSYASFPLSDHTPWSRMIHPGRSNLQACSHVCPKSTSPKCSSFPRRISFEHQVKCQTCEPP